MEKENRATNVILQSLLSDPTRVTELQQIVRSFDSADTRASALRAYCGKSLRNCLTVEHEVVDRLINGTSWEEVANCLDVMLANSAALESRPATLSDLPRRE
ncbi:MAG: hypothetical protein K1X83_15335 [Oligoflexia bacterium]|nr:hypothetical protein [Oligoflexia bacterium]